MVPALLPVDDLVAGIAACLGDQCEGIYLYGSSVLGDFDPARSDVDVLAVTTGVLSVEMEQRLRLMHERLVRAHPQWVDRIEVGYFSLDALGDLGRPGAGVLRISPGEPLHRTVMLPHWVTDLYSVQEHGIRLRGRAISEVLPDIPVAAFRGALSAVVADWLQWVDHVAEERHQSYVRLAMSRCLCSHETARQISKASAARWVAERHPQWRGVVEEALVWRRTDSGDANLPAVKRTVAFAMFVFAATRLS